MRNGILGTVLATGIVLAVGQSVNAQAQAAPAAPAGANVVCTQPTVDNFGNADGVGYRYWLIDLQKAVKEDDRKAIADMVYYPLVWNKTDGTVEIKSRSEFLKHYDEIFTAELKGKITGQNVKCLPGDDEGANVGNGELRFFKFARDNKFQITSVTQPGINKSNKLPWE